MKKAVSGFVVSIMATFFTGGVLACSVAGHLPSAQEGVGFANLILHVRVLEYMVAPEGNIFTSGIPPSTIRFQIIEVIKGTFEQKEIVQNGYLAEEDDWNDSQIPYNFVRPNGRRGSCSANTYKKGGDFLLLLVKTKQGDYTTNYWALGPTNEQIRPQNDPWLLWVKNAVK